MMPRLIAQVFRIDRIPRLENAALLTSECVDSSGIGLPLVDELQSAAPEGRTSLPVPQRRWSGVGRVHAVAG